MKKRNIIAMMLAAILVMQPIAALASEPSRMARLTENARDIALSDFDYLAEILMDNAVFQGVLARQFDMTLEEKLTRFRQSIEAMAPILSLTSLILDERWEAEPTEDLYIAADYLVSLLGLLSISVEGFAHISPMAAEEYIRAITFLEMMQAELDKGETELTEIEMMAMMTQAFRVLREPATLWLYGVNLDTLDLSIDPDALFRRNEGNVTTRIIEPDRVAYIHIASFMNSLVFDGEIFRPFFE